MRVMTRVNAGAECANPHVSLQDVLSTRPLAVVLLVAAMGCATTWDGPSRTNQASGEVTWECRERAWELSGPGWHSDWVEAQKRKVCTRNRRHELTRL